ncbi:DUF7059 domain-containing protein [Corynebacterium lowii]|uniref:Ribosomal RNA small subunit methyltransferase C n=1 Tax=Corynebacterium lowii TaxID=1544413 RepID=A0A0Q1E1Y4_9CORY|nr:methyltransferase [Corynebacterium lowii]KQB86534.1 Ribosomal RNA small subunit methyltransferase C [Corynebacterium lowii]MDP9851214.1 methylase of polypeptide subunit release factors [Corynebacterium lowii]
MPLSALAGVARELSVFLQDVDCTVEGVRAHLGESAYAALYRGEPAAVRRAVPDDSPLSLAIRLFLLRDEVPVAQCRAVLGESLCQGLVEAQALEVRAELARMLIDVRPHVLSGQNHWVFSDADASVTQHVPGPDHVLGVGAASISLLHSVPTSPVESLLDLGAGSGIQALGQWDCARRLTLTDVHPRALDFARATLAGAAATSARPEAQRSEAQNPEVEVLEGSWFEPVAGRRFDRIVSNPPFVVGPPSVGHVYRDSGLALDGASRLLLSQVHEYLNPGGTAHLVAAWVHREGESWQSRVASWLPAQGVRAWVLQRDVADPALYVGTWLRDESLDPRSPEAARRSEEWLDFFEREGVTGVGFGFVALERLEEGQPSEVVAEEIHQEFSDPLGPEVEEYFLRTGWLRQVRGSGEILSCRFKLRPSVARERVEVADAATGMGFRPATQRLVRMDGPRFSHEVDEHIAAIVSGLHPEGLCLGEVMQLYCAARDIDAEAVAPEVSAAVVDLVRHGLLLPADVLADTSHGEPEHGDVEEAR